MRRSMKLLPALSAVAALAFAPVTTAADDGPSLELTAAAADGAVEGTLAYSGAMTASVDDAGDPSVPSVGLDVGDVRMAQEGADLVVELDVLDAAAGEVAPTALYKVDLTSTLSLMAFRGPGQWDYQLADFSDGYASSPAEGSFDGSVVTWRVPSSAFGTRGTGIVAKHLSSQGASPLGIASLQLSGFVTVDEGRAVAQFFTAGRIDVTVTDADGAEVAEATTFAAPDGSWSHDASTLAPGTYTVTATSRYADLEVSTATAVTVG